MVFINKGSTAKIVKVAYNSKGGVIGLTNAVITASFSNGDTAFAGAVSIINETLGVYMLTIASTDTSSLIVRDLQCQVSILKDSVRYADIFYIKIVDNRDSGIIYLATSATGQLLKGTSAERITKGGELGATDIMIWIDTTELTTYSWSGSEWI